MMFLSPNRWRVIISRAVGQGRSRFIILLVILGIELKINFFKFQGDMTPEKILEVNAVDDTTLECPLHQTLFEIGLWIGINCCVETRSIRI